MLTRPYLLHALSPVHVGTGQSADVIDLSIARMRATGIPIVPGSSVKGVLRDARDSKHPRDDALVAVFGPPTTEASNNAGALVVGDARLLALPVRSFRGTFAWVSSPLLLDLARRDFADPGDLDVPPSVEAWHTHKACVGALPSVDGRNDDARAASLNVHRLARSTSLLLEDLDLPAEEDAAVAAWASFLAPWVAPAGETLAFERRFAVVDDETMTFLWETATQLDTRVRLSSATRTVAKGQLWVEESLPAETLLLGLMAAERSRNERAPLAPGDVLAHALPTEAILQFGGKATVGRGRCRILPLTQVAR